MVSTFRPIVQYSAEKCSGTVKKKKTIWCFYFLQSKLCVHENIPNHNRLLIVAESWSFPQTSYFFPRSIFVVTKIDFCKLLVGQTLSFDETRS